MCRQVQQLHLARLSFYERADRGTVVWADDEVPFPMPRDRSVGGLEAAVVHGEHGLREPAASTDLATVTTAMITPRSQR